MYYESVELVSTNLAVGQERRKETMARSNLESRALRWFILDGIPLSTGTAGAKCLGRTSLEAVF